MAPETVVQCEECRQAFRFGELADYQRLSPPWRCANPACRGERGRAYMSMMQRQHSKIVEEIRKDTLAHARKADVTIGFGDAWRSLAVRPIPPAPRPVVQPTLWLLWDGVSVYA